MIAKRISAFLLIGLVAGAAAACDDDDDIEVPQAEVFVANINGAQEVPAKTTTATGTGRVEFTATGLIYTVSVTNLQGVTNAHIHGPAAPGVNAGVILNLNPTAGTVNGVLAAATVNGPGTTAAAVSMDSLKTLIRNGQAYINIHTTTDPGGHIRGQLTRQN